MKKMIIAAAIIAASATAATAGGWKPPQGGNSNASAAASASQGQHQGQMQGQGQGQAQSTSVNNNIEAGAYAPGFGVDNCAYSVSAGWVGGGAGVGIPSKRCNVYTETGMIYELTGDKDLAMAHLAKHNNRVRATVKAAGSPAAPAMAKTQASYKRPSVRPAAYTKCEMQSDGTVLMRKRRGHTSEQARSECLAKLGY